jgi:hypothetical protein
MSLTREEKELRSAALTRIEAWQDAFRSLIYGYRYCQVDDFYVLLSTTAVFFGRRSSCMQDGEERNESEMIACISSATPGMLGLLGEQGIDFRTLRTSSQQGSRVEYGDGDDGNDEAQQQPPLIIRGAANVHALFNFLVEVGPTLSNAADVPILVCDAPFVGGQLMPTSCRDSRSTRAEDGSLRHSVTLEGLLTGRQFHGLCEALRKRQNEGFVVIAESEKRSTRLTAGMEISRLETGAGAAKPAANGPRVISRLTFAPDGDNGVLVFTKPV